MKLTFVLSKDYPVRGSLWRFSSVTKPILSFYIIFDFLYIDVDNRERAPKRGTEIFHK